MERRGKANMVLFFSAFVTVFLLVFQQQNIIHKKYVLSAITSAFITIFQFVVIKGVAAGGVQDMGFMIIGGMLGVLSSMKSHEWMIEWFGNRSERS
jgi:glycopeptide antibiotics resistance protein